MRRASGRLRHGWPARDLRSISQNLSYCPRENARLHRFSEDSGLSSGLPEISEESLINKLMRINLISVFSRAPSPSSSQASGDSEGRCAAAPGCWCDHAVLTALDCILRSPGGTTSSAASSISSSAGATRSSGIIWKPAAAGAADRRATQAFGDNVWLLRLPAMIAAGAGPLLCRLRAPHRRRPPGGDRCRELPPLLRRALRR